MPFRRILLCAAALVAFLAFAGNASAAGTCELYAAPTGFDAAAGTATAPVQTVSRLARILQPGQVGCLRTGVYAGEGSTYKELKITTPGITIASAPGEVAEIDARVWIARGADRVSFERLMLEGANSRDLPSPTVNADDATFREDEVTNDHTSICFVLGNTTYGKAVGTVIRDSVVHGCGETPSTNQEHGIYLSDAEDTVIRRNWIYDNVDRGIQLYPDAQDTLITENVLYGNGEGIIFSGNMEVAASGTVVTHNLIADSQIRRNVESFYPEGGPHGVDNEVRENCIFGAPSAYYAGRAGSGIQEPEVGFAARGNVTAAPQFVNAVAGNFQLTTGTGCAPVLGTAALLEPGLPGVGPTPPALPIIQPVGIVESPALAPTVTKTEASAPVPSTPGNSSTRSTALASAVVAGKPVRHAKRHRRPAYHGKGVGKRSDRHDAARRKRAAARKGDG
jgi:hypothetical protein